MYPPLLTLLFVLIITSFNLVLANDQDLFDQFEDDVSITYDRSYLDTIPIDGHLSLGSHYAFSQPTAPFKGLSSLKSTLKLQSQLQTPMDGTLFINGHLSYDAIHTLRGRDQYTTPFLDTNEWDHDWGQVYLRIPLHHQLDLSIGRQLVNWGYSDLFPGLNLINPLDNRQIGLTDFTLVKLPVGMTRLSLEVNQWLLNSYYLFETRYPKWPSYGSDFYLSDSPPPPLITNTDPQYGMSATRHFQEGDLGLYWAKLIHHSPYLAPITNGVIQSYSSITVLGGSATYPLQSWLLKGSAAYLTGLKSYHQPQTPLTQLRVTTGLDYQGFSNALLTIEAQWHYYPTFDPLLITAPDNLSQNVLSLGLLYQQSFLRDTLSWTHAFFITELPLKGTLYRGLITYKLSDHHHLSLGLIRYSSGENNVFSILDMNDRILLESKIFF